VNPLEQRFWQLKTEISNLEIKSEESQIAYTKAKEFSKIIVEFTREDKKGKEAYLKGMRNYYDTQLDHFRNKIELVRKVSPQTSLELEKKINEYEKASLEIDSAYSKNFENISDSESLSLLLNVAKMIYYAITLEETINHVSNTLLDAIDFLDGNKSNL